MELRSAAATVDFVGPTLVTGDPVDSEEVPGAGAQENALTRDRRCGEDSAAGLENPEIVDIRGGGRNGRQHEDREEHHYGAKLHGSYCRSSRIPGLNPSLSAAVEMASGGFSQS